MNLDVCIYTRSDSKYFPGLVALLNSLKRNGVSYPVYLVDTGLTQKQIEFIKELADIKIIRPEIANYELDKSKIARYNNTVFAGLEIPFPNHDIIIHLDADAIVLDSLDPLIEAAMEHGFAATGEIPPNNMKTHFWGMPPETGRALQSTTRAEQEIAYKKITDKYGPLEDDCITFNSGIWATRNDYYANNIRPVLDFIKGFHKEIWGLEQAMLNIAAYYSNPVEPFREVGSRFNSRSEYSYFNQNFGTSGYRIAAPRLLTDLEEAKNDSSLPIVLNGVGGRLAIIHFVWKPKPWESVSTLSNIWEFFADLTPGWRAVSSKLGEDVSLPLVYSYSWKEI